MSRLIQLLTTAPILWLTAQAYAEPKRQCYLIPEIVQLPKELSGYTPQIFSPNGESVILSKENKKVLFYFNDSKSEILGDIQNPTYSASGNQISFETQDKNPAVIIRDLKSGKLLKTQSPSVCGHRLSETQRQLQILTCNGLFKQYDLNSDPPQLLHEKPSNYSFRTNEPHFNLDTRGSFILSPSEDEASRSLIHLIDFKNEKIFAAPMTLPRKNDPIQYLTDLNSSNTPVELRNEIARNFRTYGGASISPNGRVALIWDSDGSAIHIDLDQGTSRSISKTRDPSMSFALSRQGSFVFSRKTGPQDHENDGWIHSYGKFHFDQVTFADDDSKIAYTTPNQNEIRIINLKTRKEIRLPHVSPSTDKLATRDLETLFFDSDSKQLLVYQKHKDQPELQFINTETGQLEKTLPLTRNTFHRENRIFDHTGKKLFIGNAPFSPNGITNVINLETGETEKLEESVPRQFNSDSPLVLWPYAGYKNSFLRNRSVCTQAISTEPLSKPDPCNTINSLSQILPSDFLKQTFTVITRSRT